MAKIPVIDDPASLASKNVSAETIEALNGAFIPAALWQNVSRLSTLRLSQMAGWLGNVFSWGAGKAELFLSARGFDRAPWLAVVFACGILSWFGTSGPSHWLALIASACALSGAVMAYGLAERFRDDPDGQRHEQSRRTIMAVLMVFAAGISVIWLRAELVGAPAIKYPTIDRVEGYILKRVEQPSQQRVRLTLAVRDRETAKGMKIRINVEQSQDQPGLSEGAVIRVKVRLMPPASPMLPGAYDFARAAFFKGLSATGTALDRPRIISPPAQKDALRTAQRSLARHVRARVDGAAGTIAATFASGDRGAISAQDAGAMRDSGLTHLLAISGLHVGAVIAAGYFGALKLLGLVPFIALRMRLPLIAAMTGAACGIGYTLLTGAQVPTVRSCIASLLVLIALSLGREALSFRMVASAAICVLLLWPESVIGPSFQMSFCAVIAIVALHQTAFAKAFLAPREEAWVSKAARHIAMLFLTSLVIEIALMPIVLFHFHRAGFYGAFANLLAIPLVTFVSMPLIALALLLDLAGLGWPLWWIVGCSLDFLLALAHFTAAQPGAVKLMPQMTGATIALFVGGGLWLALWTGRVRLWVFAPLVLATSLLVTEPPPDILVGRDGRQVGIRLADNRLLSLRDTQSGYVRDNLLELAGVKAKIIPLDQWPLANCSPGFCLVTLERGGETFQILMARNGDMIAERNLAAACARADIVIASRFLPRSCQPSWIKADKSYLKERGGLSIDLARRAVNDVASSQGRHGWWRPHDQW